MKFPKTVRRYCPFCKKHTEHSVSRVKGRKRRKTTKDERSAERKRKGYGSFPFKNPKGREKPTRRLDLRYKCKECGKKHPIGKGFRVKKFELV